MLILLCASGAEASPALGAHTLAFYACGGSGGLSTPPITSQPSGSTILAWVGRGDISSFTSATAPTDNKTNTFSLIGSVHNYSPLWPGSGEALYASVSAVGGSGHIVTAPMPGTDEITLAVVEITNGGAIQDVQWNLLTSSSTTQTSLNVTTTGAATLVAIWAGDSGADAVTAIPNNGFVTNNSQLVAICDVQVVVATKSVASAGTYNVTWTSTPAQGAHLWLVAVQAAPPTLQAKVSGNTLVVSWPVSAGGYDLEMTSNFLAGSFWTPVTNMPAIFNSQNTITNIISPGAGFFRLKKP